MIKIDLFHDTACPWCRIGKQHLKLALAQWDGPPVNVHYRTFFLNETIPPEGYEFHSFMKTKGGGRIPLEGFFAAPRQMGADAGLNFNFEAIEKAPNTTLSHRLIALTPENKKDAVIDDVYDAYFQQGRDIGALDVLLDIARAAGLDAEAMKIHLQDGMAMEQVIADNQWARMQGINGVPFFIFNDKYAFSGAQPPEIILQVLSRVAEEALKADR